MSDNQARVKAVTDGVEEKYGLPKGLLFKMAGQESGFTSDAVSPKNAKGWFQFMPETAKAYGVDDPTDLAQSAEGAGKYMADNMKKYGDLHAALADYNGGPKAVHALRQGTPWKETAGYIKGITGEDATSASAASPGASPGLSTQFTSGSAEEPTSGPSASALAAQHAGEPGFLKKAAGLPGAVAAGFELDNIFYNSVVVPVKDWWENKTVEDMGPPQELTDEGAKATLEGIRPEHWDYVLQGTNDKERNVRRGRSLDAMAQEQELGKLGWAGVIGRLPGSLIDLPSLLMFVPGADVAGVMTVAGRVGNAVRMGLVMGAANAAIEAATYQNRPLGTTHDIYMAAAMGVGMGALTGGLTNPARFALHAENEALQGVGLKAANAGHLEEIRAAGMEPNQAYKDFLEGLTAKKDAAMKDINTGLKDWSIGQPHDVNVPVMPKREGLSVVRPYEEPSVPLRDSPEAPKGLPTGKAPAAPVEAPRAPLEARPGGPMPVQGKTIAEIADYMRNHSQNPALVAVMERALKGVDLRKMDFRVLEKGERWAGTTAADMAIGGSVGKSHGAVMTPSGSTGEGLKMFLAGASHGIERTGMTEEIFTHELVHAASVYKMKAAENPKGGLHVEPVAHQAAKDIVSLHGMLKKEAMKTFGAGWETSLGGRLGPALQNTRELLAYGLTNEGFQGFLKSVKMPGAPQKSIWDHFVKTLRNLLGIGDKEHNAFTRLIELSGPLTKKGGVTKVGSTDLVASHPGSIDEATVAAANQADVSPVFGWGLGLEHKLGSAKVPPSVRNEAAKLFGTTVGYKDHSVVKANAWDMTNALAERWAKKLRTESYIAFEDWFKGTGRPKAEKGKAFDEFGTQVSDYVRDLQGTYSPQVQKAGEAVRKVLAEAADHINNPSTFNGGKKLGLTETLVTDPVTGVQTIVGTLVHNPNYLPRKHDVTKWSAMVNQFGRDAVEGWWARAYQSARTGIDTASAQKWAGWYMRTVEEAHVNRTQDLLGDLLQGTDKDALKNSLMRNGGYTEAQALHVMVDMLPTKGTDTGALQASLKHRNSINEKYKETLVTKDGQSIPVTLNDFTFSNALTSVEPYLRRTAGNVALAEHLGVYKVGDIGKRIAAATENKFGPDIQAGADVASHRKYLQLAYDQIQGIPTEEFSGFNKSMEMWRTFNVLRSMGGAVWNQASEMSQIVGSMGWKAMLRAIPELKSLSRDIATGKAPNDLLEHLENTIGGAGSDYVRRMEFQLSDDWARNKGDTAWNRGLDKLDTKLKQFAKGTLDYTGMTPLMIQQKRIHAIALVNHFINDATGKQVSTFLTKERLAFLGMDDADFAAVKSSLAAYSSPTKGAYSLTHKLDFAAWMKNEPETHAKFMEAIHRETRRVIQENDLGSMIPIMGTTLGKTMFQFMNFSMHGWNKSLMFALNHRDFSTLSTVLHGGLLGGLSYMGRTLISSVGMDADQKQTFLDQRMSVKQIVANSIGKTAQASLLPNLYDSTLGNLTGPMFSGMRTTSDISSIASNPTLSAINSTLSLMKIGKNAVSGESQTTQHDVRQWGKLVPLNNVAPVSTLLNAVANDYPTSAKQD